HHFAHPPALRFALATVLSIRLPTTMQSNLSARHATIIRSLRPRFLSDCGESVPSADKCLAYQTHTMNSMATMKGCPAAITPFWFKLGNASAFCDNGKDGLKPTWLFAWI